jgi:ATP-binding cassette, subfamily B, bacterial MsbA
VIAHRLSTVRRATRTVVLEDGRITAIGSHEELLRISPTYQRLYELQFAGGSEGFLPEIALPVEASR